MFIIVIVLMICAAAYRAYLAAQTTSLPWYGNASKSNKCQRKSFETSCKRSTFAKLKRSMNTGFGISRSIYNRIGEFALPDAATEKTA